MFANLRSLPPSHKYASFTVARFLTCLMMWEILRAFTDDSLSSGIVIPDASIVTWGFWGGEARSPRSGPLRCSLVARVCPCSRCPPRRRYIPPAVHVVLEM